MPKRFPKSWSAFSRWLQAERRNIDVDILLLGFARKTSLVLQAFDRSGQNVDPESMKRGGGIRACARSRAQGQAGQDIRRIPTHTFGHKYLNFSKKHNTHVGL